MSNPTCDSSCVPPVRAAGQPAGAFVPGLAEPLSTSNQEASEPPTPLRTTHDLRRLDGWALVLVSRGLHPVASFENGRFGLHVPEHEQARASAELNAADAEDREALHARQQERARPPRAVGRPSLIGGVAVALLLLAFFALTGPRAAGSAWFAAGASDAERVLQGEWWRALTALTLHADGAHVASNIGIGALVVGAVMRSEGVGWGAALVLVSGTLGNLLNAWAHQTLHSSVGFSTAVFGAIGLLGGLAYAQGRTRRQRQRPAWTALAGSLALLAALGSSERSDLFAHLFGGLAGVALGVMLGLLRWRPSIVGQWLAGLGAALALVTAWLGALR